jgi:hypothetical protein
MQELEKDEVNEMSWEDTIRKGLTPEDYREMDARDAMNAPSHAKEMDRIIKKVQDDLKEVKNFITAFHNHTGSDDWEYDLQPSLRAFDNLKKELEEEIKEYYERQNYQGE